MAIDIESARLLLTSQKRGVSFKKCVTLGRQSYLPGNKETRFLLRDFGLAAESFPKLFLSSRGGRYAEEFFKLLGCEQLDSIDMTDFEGATIIHDLNKPMPEKLKEQFDAVYDGGTLEHVFNFLFALKNCMELVKLGGRFIMNTPANNFFGHGFYQFSPELFFRVFSKENGFLLEHMVAVEYGPLRRWYEVIDPALVKSRGELTNSFRILLYLQAKRTGTIPHLLECPQQSDYSTMWNSYQNRSNAAAQEHESARSGLLPWIKRALIESNPSLARAIEAFVFSSANKRFSFRNREAFVPIKKR